MTEEVVVKIPKKIAIFFVFDDRIIKLYYTTPQKIAAVLDELEKKGVTTDA